MTEPTTPPAPPKQLKDRSKLEFTLIIIGATFLAANAGVLNGICYQSNDVPTSHVTGTTTFVGIAIGTHDYNMIGIRLCIVCCFIFGSAISGFRLNDNSFTFHEGYALLFYIGFFLLILACVSEYYNPSTYYYSYFAACACGLQNGLTSKYSGSILRSTHMTGCVTDIGLVLGKWAKNDDKPELWRLYVLVPTYVSFLLGGALSVPIFKSMGKLSLMINAFLFLFIGIVYSVVISRRYHTVIFQSIDEAVVYAASLQNKISDSISTVNPLHV